MTVELKGTVHAIFSKEQVTDNFTKQELVVTVDEDTQYPQQIIAQCVNAKCDQLNGISHGMKVKVSCNLRGKESNGKYYNRLEAWKIEKI